MTIARALDPLRSLRESSRYLARATMTLAILGVRSENIKRPRWSRSFGGECLYSCSLSRLSVAAVKIPSVSRALGTLKHCSAQSE